MTLTHVVFPSKERVSVFVWTLVWCVALVAIAEGTLRGWNGYLPPKFEPYMLSHERDVWVHNAFQISRLKAEEETSEKMNILLWGGSTSLAAIMDDPTMERLLKDRAGKEINFISLSSNLASGVDFAKLIEKIGPTHATLFIGIEPDPLQRVIDVQLDANISGKYFPKYVYLPVPERIQPILERYDGPLPISRQLLLHRTAKLLGESIRNRINKRFIKVAFYSHNRERNQQSYVPQLEVMREHYSVWPGRGPYFEKNFELLKEGIRMAKDNGIRIVLMDLPYPLSSKIFREKVDVHYDRLIQSLVKEESLGYLDTRHWRKWEDIDFSDPSHLNQKGRTAFTGLFIEHIAKHVTQ